MQNRTGGDRCAAHLQFGEPSTWSSGVMSRGPSRHAPATGRPRFADHAMLLLIAAYGLRSGEVRHLCLEHIDWGTGDHPHPALEAAQEPELSSLVHEVGTAILRYLREVRPRSTRREIFLSVVQPYRTLSAGGFGAMVHKRLHRLGIVSVSYGPHSASAFLCHPSLGRRCFAQGDSRAISATCLWSLLRFMRRLIFRGCAKWVTCPWLDW